MSVGRHTRESIRKAHADMLAAIERRKRVMRPDGTDSGGHPGIEAANLEGYLGRFAVPLLDALEASEGEVERLRAELNERSDHDHAR